MAALANPVESSLTIVGSGEPISQENLVQFHLLYSGPLHSDGNVSEKWRIRKTVHMQLRRLWHTNPNLLRLAESLGVHDYSEWINSIPTEEREGVTYTLTTEQFVARGLATIGKNWNRHGLDYVPLVTAEHCLRCSLDILFLRAEEKNYVLQAGDIDGRLKTLFDGMRIARDANELPRRGATITDDERPLFCLLENDELISDINITTGQLLHLPEEKEFNKSDVYLQIGVRLNATRLTPYSWAF